MKPNGVLINTARGTVVVEEDLLAHLEANPNFWYGCDVLNGEPADKEWDWEHPLAKHPRVYGSHHIGASTKQAEDEIGVEAVRICKVFAKTGSVDSLNWVNRDRSVSSQTLVIKAKKGASVFSDVFSIIETHGWTIGENETLMCEGGKAFILKINGEGPANVVDALQLFKYFLL